MKLRTIAVGVLLFLVLVPSVVPAIASDAARSPSTHAGASSPEGASAESSEPAGDSWMGAVAAVMCGVFARVTISTGGSSVGTIAATVAACAFMVLDSFADDD